jgi:bilin biosynthesis protein
MTASPTVIDPEQTDRLLPQVEQQLATQTFNPQDSQLLKTLVETLGDPRGIRRLRCAEILGEIGRPATPFLVEALLNHENVVVRRAAAKTITLIEDPAAIEPLMQALLNDDDIVVKGSSVGALARIGKPAVPQIISLLESPTVSEDIKGHAAWALAFVGAEAREELVWAMGSALPDVRLAVVGAISKVVQEYPEDEVATALLVQALQDDHNDVRVEAMTALGNLRYQPAMPKLLALLQSDAWETRKAAVLALMKLEDDTAIAPLQAALAQESELPVEMVLKLAIAMLEQRSASIEDEW